MLALYVDESGLHAEARAFCLAGYLGTSATWFELSRAWRRTLDNHGVSSFHMSEFENWRGPFAQFGKAQHESLITELVSIVNAADVAGFGIGVVLSDYSAWKDRLVATKGLFKPWWDEPYLLAYQWLLVEVGVEADENSLSGPIAVTIERSGTFEARIRETHSAYIGAPNLARGRIGSLTVGAPEDHTPLQVVDLLAYEVWKFVERRLANPVCIPRISMGRLLHRIQRIKYFDASALQSIAESPT
jgi:hypothetical protein